MHYSKIISKTYCYLLAFSLHFEEKENQSIEIIDNKNSNSIFEPRNKIASYLEKICINNKKFFIIVKSITIDESLIYFTGRNNMKYIIPMKPYKWGFKIHIICDSDIK